MKTVRIEDIPIGGISPTGAIRTGPDTFVAEWVWRYAPFRARESNAFSNRWRVDRADGKLIYFQLDEEHAKRCAEELNMLAAAAQLLRV